MARLRLFPRRSSRLHRFGLHSFAAAFVTATIILLLGIAAYLLLLERKDRSPNRDLSQ